MRRGNIEVLAALVAAIGVVSACGGDTDTSNGPGPSKDAGADTTADVVVVDAGADVGAVDAGVDVVVVVDAEVDVAVDAPSDGAANEGSVDSGVTPGSLTGLMLWLAADVGVTPGPGSSVAQWADQSGLNNHATANNTGNQPQRVFNALASKPVIHFDGGSQYFSLPSGFADFSAGFSAFIVVQPEMNTLVHGARFFDFASGYGSLSNSLLLARFEQADEILYQTYPGASPGAALDVNNIVVNGVWQTFEVVHAAGAPQSLASASLYKDGLLVSNGLISVAANVTRFSNLIGRSNLSQDAYLTGGIAEIVMYARALSDAERLQIETYLNAKWAL
jgi:hypothetical protein